MDDSFANVIKTLLFWGVVILLVSFVLWYLSGGARRWDNQFEKIEGVKEETSQAEKTF